MDLHVKALAQPPVNNCALSTLLVVVVQPSQVLLKPHVEDRQEKENAKALQAQPMNNCALTTLEVIALHANRGSIVAWVLNCV